MKGKYQILIQDKRTRYEFEIRRNITVIRGDSATGKTTLVEMLAAFGRAGEASGVQVSCECRLAVATDEDWEYRIAQNPGAILFVDEGNHFVATKEFASAARRADNYFVLIARDRLPNLPYSVEEIYGIRTSQRYAGLKQVYHELYHLYGDVELLDREEAEALVVEDSHSGFEFFKALADGNHISVLSAGGKSNLARILEVGEVCHPFLIADGAAFGPEIDHIETLRLGGYKVALYLPESFEWIVLRSDVLDDREVREILAHPEDYIDSREYFSWEPFFTKLLTEKSRGTYLQYQKSALNPVYLQEKTRDRIAKVLPEVLQKWLAAPADSTAGEEER